MAMSHKTGKVALVSAFLVLLFFASTAASLSCANGAFDFAGLCDCVFGSSEESAKLILLQIRLPRLAAGILSGACLAMAGCCMQSLFRNPLADPSILGVSSGAALGAVVAMSFFAYPFALESCALIGGARSGVCRVQTRLIRRKGLRVFYAFVGNCGKRLLRGARRIFYVLRARRGT